MSIGIPKLDGSGSGNRQNKGRGGCLPQENSKQGKGKGQGAGGGRGKGTGGGRGQGAGGGRGQGAGGGRGKRQERNQ
jgi:hypothetical protein